MTALVGVYSLLWEGGGVLLRGGVNLCWFLAEFERPLVLGPYAFGGGGGGVED